MATETHINVKNKLPPCRAACPARVNVQGYVSLIQKGNFKEAVELIRKDMPFPAICGRVCFSPCEDACARVNLDQAVAIRALKRIVADIEREQGHVKPVPVPKTHSEKVALIGAGPAGLTAAYELAKLGYPVVVFERMPEPGGMMRYCIPDFRLEKFVVAKETAYIHDIGVEIKTGVEFGKDITLKDLWDDGYKAVFLAIGTQLSKKMNVPGEEFEGVFHVIEFLKAAALGQHVDVGQRVAVIGGGNSAIDAARTANRLGAKETMILYRRTRNEMPALSHEIEAAEREGILFHFLVSPKRIVGKSGKAVAIECLRMRLGEPDASGRRRPIPIGFSEHQYQVDLVIPALGQIPETLSILPELLESNARNALIPADSETLETKIPGVFAGGDIVTGPASIIQAVGAGRQAAISIHQYLIGKRAEGKKEEVEETTWVKDWDSLRKKTRRYEAPVQKPRLSFEEAERFLKETKRKAMFEAFRCLACGPCSECLAEIGSCRGDKAIIEKDRCTGCNVCAIVCPVGAVEKSEEGVAKVDEELCKGCGICAAHCPERAITMQHFTDEYVLNCASIGLRRNDVS